MNSILCLNPFTLNRSTRQNFISQFPFQCLVLMLILIGSNCFELGLEMQFSMILFLQRLSLARNIWILLHYYWSILEKVIGIHCNELDLIVQFGLIFFSHDHVLKGLIQLGIFGHRCDQIIIILNEIDWQRLHWTLAWNAIWYDCFFFHFFKDFL